MNLSEFLSNEHFHQLMEKIDRDLSEQTQTKGCTCGGRLHHANYPRKPLGVPEEFSQFYQKRESFCCERDNCRKRITPASVRFFGRNRFVAPILLLISALACGVSEKRCKKLEKLFGVKVSKKTWLRWSRWWRDIFPTTHFWKVAVGMVSLANVNEHFPRSFLNSYAGALDKRIVLTLHFLAPLCCRFS